MDNRDGDSPLERLQRSLYEKQPPREDGANTPLHRHDEKARTSERAPAPDAGGEDRQEQTESRQGIQNESADGIITADIASMTTGGSGAKTSMPLSYKLLIAAAVFFVASVSVFLFIFLGGVNVVSTQNVAIDVSGPSEVAAGESVTFQLAIRNDNAVRITEADLIVEFPEGSRVSGNLGEDLSRIRRPLGTVASGGIVEETVEAAFFGEKGEEKTMTISVEYRTEDSNAVFVADSTFSFRVKSTPLSLLVEMPSEVSAGQEFDARITVSSNAETVLENVVLAARTPFGYELKEASSPPEEGEDVWRFGTLRAGEDRSIVIRGTVQGQNGEEKVFRFEVGTADAPDASRIAVRYSRHIESMRIVSPFLGVSVSLNGVSDGDISVRPGDLVDGIVRWRNNTPVRITDARIEIRLSGDAFDRRSVAVQRGFYRSSDDTIIWDKNSVPSLAELRPGAGGDAEFSLSLLPNLSPRAGAPRMATLVFTARGTRLTDGAGDEITTKVTRDIVAATTVRLSQRGLYGSGPFPNSGPVPPVAEQETTYTIEWSLVNTLNPVSGGKVEAELPPYVEFTGTISPSDARITFNEDTRTVRWEIPSLKPGVGVRLPPREAAFQIRFLPSLSQVGDAPVLVRSASFTGRDDAADEARTAVADSVTTSVSSDPTYSTGDGVVVE